MRGGRGKKTYFLAEWREGKTPRYYEDEGREGQKNTGFFPAGGGGGGGQKTCIFRRGGAKKPRHFQDRGGGGAKNKQNKTKKLVFSG